MDINPSNNKDTYHARGARIDALEEVLRSLASYLGAGGFNAIQVDPNEFEAKIRWGIRQLEDEIMLLRQKSK